MKTLSSHLYTKRRSGTSTNTLTITHKRGHEGKWQNAFSRPIMMFPTNTADLKPRCIEREHIWQLITWTSFTEKQLLNSGIQTSTTLWPPYRLLVRRRSLLWKESNAEFVTRNTQNEYLTMDLCGRLYSTNIGNYLINLQHTCYTGTNQDI